MVRTHPNTGKKILFLNAASEVDIVLKRTAQQQNAEEVTKQTG
ncbi:hypothetical protein [Nostoc sp. PCC 9305]